MKTILKLVCLCVTLIVTSCSGDLENISDINSQIYNGQAGMISARMSKSLEKANKMTDKVSKKRTREVAEIEYFGAQTRSNNNSNAGYYIVNYKDGGFTIISADADSENPEVLAFSDKGSIHLRDTIENKGLSWYINDYLTFAEANGFTTPILPPAQPFEYAYVAPILPENLSLFNQSTPWNKYCPSIDGTHCLVGCAPLAAGTLMGYYEWPKSYNGYSFDWASMKTNNMHDSWAKLFYFIGLPGNMNVSYGVKGTGASKATYVSTFNNMGYPNAKLVDFNITEILYPQFMKKQPVMARGTRGTSGHAWVMDGIYAQKNTGSEPTNSENTEYSFYTHCVWGWGGNNNGYFLISENTVTVGDRTYKGLQVVYDFTH